MERAEKATVVAEHRKHEKDCGSTEVQVALLSKRIDEQTEHLKAFPKDYAARRGLLMLVGKRTRLLRYLNLNQPEAYQQLLQKLGLRK